PHFRSSSSASSSSPVPPHSPPPHQAGGGMEFLPQSLLSILLSLFSSSFSFFSVWLSPPLFPVPSSCSSLSSPLFSILSAPLSYVLLLSSQSVQLSSLSLSPSL